LQNDIRQGYLYLEVQSALLILTSDDKKKTFSRSGIPAKHICEEINCPEHILQEMNSVEALPSESVNSFLYYF